MSPKIVHTTDNSLLDVVQKLLRPRHQPLRRLHADAVGDTAERHWRQSPRHVGTRVAPIKAGELDDTLALLRREPVAASCGGASRQQARQEGQQLRCELSTCVPRDARGGAVRLRGGGEMRQVGWRPGVGREAAAHRPACQRGPAAAGPPAQGGSASG